MIETETGAPTVLGPLNNVAAKELKLVATSVNKLTQVSTKNNGLLTAILRFLKSNINTTKESLISSDDFTPIVDAFDKTIETNASALSKTSDAVAAINKDTATTTKRAVKELIHAETADALIQAKFDEKERKKQAIHAERERKKQERYDNKQRNKQAKFDEKERKLNAAKESKGTAPVSAEKKERKAGPKGTASTWSVKHKEAPQQIVIREKESEQQTRDKRRDEHERRKQKRQERECAPQHNRRRTSNRGNHGHPTSRHPSQYRNNDSNDTQSDQGYNALDVIDELSDFDTDNEHRNRRPDSRDTYPNRTPNSEPHSTETPRRTPTTRSNAPRSRFGRAANLLRNTVNVVEEAPTGLLARGAQVASKAVPLLGKAAGALVSEAGPIGALMAGVDEISNISNAIDVNNDVNATKEQKIDATGSAVGGGLGAIAGGILGSVVPVLGTMAGAAIGEQVGSFLGSHTSDAINVISEVSTSVMGSIGDAASYIEDGFEDNVIAPIASASESVMNGIDSAADTISSTVITPIVDTASTISNNVKEGFDNNVVQPVSKISDAVTDSAKNLDIGQLTQALTVAGPLAMGAALATSLSDVDFGFDKFEKNLKSVFTPLDKSLSEYSDNFSEGASVLGKGLSEAGSTIAGGFRNLYDRVTKAYEEGSANGGGITGGAVAAAKSVAGQLPSFGESVVTGARQAGEAVSTSARVATGNFKFKPEVASAIDSVAKSENVDPNFMRTMTYIESRGNPNAKNASGAKGLNQFVPSTARHYGIEGKEFDINANLTAGAQFAKDNAHALQKRGIEATPEMMYIAHQQGVGGASALVNDAKAQKTWDQLSPERQRNMASNGGQGQSAQEFLDMWKSKYKRAEAVANKNYQEPEVTATVAQPTTPEKSKTDDSAADLGAFTTKIPSVIEPLSLTPSSDSIIKNDTVSLSKMDNVTNVTNSTVAAENSTNSVYAPTTSSTLTTPNSNITAASTVDSSVATNSYNAAPIVAEPTASMDGSNVSINGATVNVNGTNVNVDGAKQQEQPNNEAKDRVAPETNISNTAVANPTSNNVYANNEQSNSQYSPSTNVSSNQSFASNPIGSILNSVMGAPQSLMNNAMQSLTNAPQTIIGGMTNAIMGAPGSMVNHSASTLNNAPQTMLNSFAQQATQYNNAAANLPEKMYSNAQSSSINATQNAYGNVVHGATQALTSSIFNGMSANTQSSDANNVNISNQNAYGNTANLDVSNEPSNLQTSSAIYNDEARITQTTPSDYSVERSIYTPMNSEPPEIIMPEFNMPQMPQQASAPTQSGVSGGSMGGSGRNTRPSIDEIPISINDSGLMLLNVGYL